MPYASEDHEILEAEQTLESLKENLVVDKLAGAMYGGYCKWTDYKSAITGEPLPTWEEMKESKPNVASAWRAAARAGMEHTGSGAVPGVKLQNGILIEAPASIGRALGVPEEITVTLKLDAGCIPGLVAEIIKASEEMDAATDARLVQPRDARSRS